VVSALSKCHFFFNWTSERVSNNSWYNIGIQDYMPTWRWWWAPSLLGRDVDAAGKADKVTLIATVEGAEDTAVREDNLQLFDSSLESDETE
jgi:endo-beta-N-acetylglucosaminidase D